MTDVIHEPGLGQYVRAIDPESGIEWGVRIVSRGETYGLNNCLTHDEDDPLVEYYDRSVFGPEGQFVSRYYLSTLGQDLWDITRGINLHGEVPSWSISGQFKTATLTCILTPEQLEACESLQNSSKYREATS